MRYGIFSDVHSNIEALNAVVSAYEKEGIDKYLCLGDVVGYASSPKECIGLVSSVSDVVIAGNHDWACVDLFSAKYFNSLAATAIKWTKEQLVEENKLFLRSLKLSYKNQDLALVHGSLDNPGNFNYLIDSSTAKETFALMQNNICFLGHTHIAGIFIQNPSGKITYQQDQRVKIQDNNKYIINAGSVGQPRDGNPMAAYCIYDTQEKQVQINRIEYDWSLTREKIIASGLPRFLGDRLLTGN
ncbi:MAG: metallophosphoesterase family protein [Candidatus Omnitrophica bacterium]|nr:metallophosphoesterase family protein [Candidatus Omnitrophota bacterium]